MSKGLGFLQSNIQDMLQDGDTLTVADVMEVAGPDYDPRHISRAFKSLHRRGKVCLTVKAGCLAVKVKSAPRSPAQGPVSDALDASDTGAGQRGSAASRRLRSEVPMVAAPRSPAPMAPAAASRPVPIQGQRQVPIELGREMPLRISPARPVERSAEEHELPRRRQKEAKSSPAEVTPPEAPLPPPSPATRFVVQQGIVDVVPPTAWAGREAQVATYHARARTIALRFSDKLANTNVEPELAASVHALVEVLGDKPTNFNPINCASHRERLHQRREPMDIRQPDGNSASNWPALCSNLQTCW